MVRGSTGRRPAASISMHDAMIRFWPGDSRSFVSHQIPKKLAYRGQDGMPQGMLVFDVKLIEILKP